MTKTAPEILQLRMDIEQNISRRILTPYDFEFLAGAIWERIHEHLSPTTLKRLWGYIDGADTARRTTLCLLSQFLGYKDWEDYLSHLSFRTDIESRTFLGDGVHTSDLSVGNQVEVTWLPNRRCVFRYDGNNCFTVIEAANAKLHVGDTFTANYFFKNQPMYLDNLVQVSPSPTSHSSSTSSSSSPTSHSSFAQPSAPVSYVAGSKGGLVEIRVIDNK